MASCPAAVRANLGPGGLWWGQAGAAPGNPQRGLRVARVKPGWWVGGPLGHPVLAWPSAAHLLHESRFWVEVQHGVCLLGAVNAQQGMFAVGAWPFLLSSLLGM